MAYADTHLGLVVVLKVVVNNGTVLPLTAPVEQQAMIKLIKRRIIANAGNAVERYNWHHRLNLATIYIYDFLTHDEYPVS